MRDSYSYSSGDFSSSKLLLVVLCGLVVGCCDLGRSDSLFLSSELLSPDGAGGAGVVLVFSSS